MLNNFKRWFAERFLEDILDEDYAMGIREGMRAQSATVRIKLDYNRTRQLAVGMTKTEAKGYDRCVEALNDYLK